MVVAQLVERSLPTPEIRASNPVIGNYILLSTVLNLYWKDKNKEKEVEVEKGQLKNFSSYT